MQVVVGGIPPLDDIVGREEETASVLRSFHGSGALLTGDRRYGKTCLGRLVERTSVDAGYAVVRVSAERRSFEDFVEALADALAQHSSAVKQELERWRVGLTAGPVTAERRARVRSLDDMVTAALAAHDSGLLVMIIDEIPVLAKRMDDDERGSGAELLHLLRRLRQDNAGRLVMVLSGSIGFHHVTKDALGAVNDVERQPVRPLKEEDAVYLARCLLLGEAVNTTDDASVAVAIAAAAERVPYYIHHLVKAARDRAIHGGGQVAPSDIPSLVDAALSDRDDPWDLAHYRDRIPAYYGVAHTELASKVIDIYADAAGLLSVDELNARLSTSGLESAPSRSTLLDLVTKLEADHYLDRVGDRSHFASELVRRAWIAHRR